MGVLGTIGLFIILGTHFNLLEVHQGWYTFWWVVTVMNVVATGLKDRK